MLYPYVHMAAAVAGLLLYVVITHAGKQRRPPSAAIAWVLTIGMLPYLAVPIFLLFGTRKLVRPARECRVADPDHVVPDVPPWAHRLTTGLALPPPRRNHRIAIFDAGPAALDALLRLLEGATRSVDLSVFIFADDRVGRRVADALAECARRGCRVRLLLDAVGGLRTPRGLRRLLVQSGVRVCTFMPLIHDPRRGRGNLRNHRKSVIADSERVWSGGRNFAEEYFLDRAGRPAWLDLSFVVAGKLADDAQSAFDRDWAAAGGEAAPALTPGDAAEHPDDRAVAQLIASGPDRPEDTLYAILLNALYQAQARILLATPYFVPGEAVVQALLTASRRGVRVRLLLPARSNHRLADWARERDLRELAASGVEVLLLPAMMHAKAVVVDDNFALCGSANLDGRSLFLNYELVTAFYSPEQVQEFVLWHGRTASLARGYAWRHPTIARDVAEGAVRSLAFQL